MKISLSFLFLITVIQACSQKPNNFQRKVLDTSINKFVLLNSVSIRNSIGDQTGKLIEDEKPSRIQIGNLDSSEFVTLFHLNGSNINTFNKFEVATSREIGKSVQVVADKLFMTESGIKLGITQQQLKAIKGKGAVQKEKNGLTILRYRFDNKNDANLIKKYNMPIYEATYYFKNNKLVKFVFGFPNL